MSHIVTITTEVRDEAAARAACQRLGLGPPTQETVSLFSAQASGLCIRLPGWNYPVVCDLPSGKLQFDNFGGQWGQQQELDNFLQAYAVERAKIEARKQGYLVTEQPLADGSIKLTIQLGGAA